ncbi:MAG: glycosyltransferase family 39 protein [Chloroflexi bacterium]|nr:glycosyltransferase family 39 protein [Chloroflexota bacterium]
METGKRNPLLDAVVILASVACAVVGQWLLARPNAGFAGALPWFLTAGAGLGVTALRRERPELWQRLAGRTAGRRAPAFVLGALALSLLTVWAIYNRETSGGGFYWDALFLWAASASTYLLAFRWPDRAWLRARVTAHRREIALVGGLTLLAAGLRFLWLARIPDVMNGDEGLHSLLARSILEGRYTHPFGTFYGAGSLHLFVAALGLKLFGYTVLASRLTPAIGGLLGVPATYLLARRLFDRPAALVAAGLVAVLHAHIQFSRVIGVGYIHATLFASLGVYLLYSALENHSARRAALGGVVMGAWLYVYIDSRFVPAVLLAWGALLLLLPRQRALILSNLRQVAAFAGGYAVAAAPMGLWAFRHWDDFSARFSSDGTLWNNYYKSLLKQGPSVDLPRTLFQQASHAFFSLTRYPMADFYQSPAPMLDTLSASLFWLALSYSLLHLLDRRHLLLNIWLWSGALAVGLLTVPRSSDGYRMLTVLIPVVLMIGALAAQLAEWLASTLGRPWSQWAVLGALLAAALALNVNLYFNLFAHSCQYGGDRQTRTAYFLGTVLAGMPPGERAIILGNDNLHYGTHASAQYLNPGVEVENLTAPLPPDPSTLPRPRAFILIPERIPDLSALQAAFPGGQLRPVDDCGAPSLYVYSLPASQGTP